MFAATYSMSRDSAKIFQNTCQFPPAVPNFLVNHLYGTVESFCKMGQKVGGVRDYNQQNQLDLGPMIEAGEADTINVIVGLPGISLASK